MTTATQDRLFEHVHQMANQLVVDTDNAIIRNVCVINHQSRNGRIYENQALDDVASIINRGEGHPVAYEHEDLEAVSTGRGTPRRALDRNGQLRSGRRQGTSTFADWHLNKAKPQTAEILEDAKNFPANLCLSPEFDGPDYDGEFGQDGKLHVTHIREMLDVALVARGGTTRKLSESFEKEPTMSTTTTAPSGITPDQLEARLREEKERTRITEELNGLKATNQTLQDANTKLKQENERLQEEIKQLGRVDRIIEQAAADPYKMTLDRAFAKTLAFLPDDAVKIQLDERKRLLESAGKSNPEQTGSFNPPSVGSTEPAKTTEDWLPVG